jgi:hypothetical protein
MFFFWFCFVCFVFSSSKLQYMAHYETVVFLFHSIPQEVLLFPAMKPDEQKPAADKASAEQQQATSS